MRRNVVLGACIYLLRESRREKTKSMATDMESHIAGVQSLLVSLLDLIQRESRCMTAGERQRYSAGVRLLARYRGCSIEEVIASLNRQVATRANAVAWIAPP